MNKGSRNLIHKTLKRIHQKACKLGVKTEIDESVFIDDDHLDCFWYGGRIGALEFNGWKIIIEVNGEVRAQVQVGDKEYCYVNKNNTGAWGEDICNIVLGDNHKNKLIETGEMRFGNNNWVEWQIESPNHERIDPMMQFDNVLDDNVLFAFENLDEFVGILHSL